MILHNDPIIKLKEKSQDKNEQKLKSFIFYDYNCQLWHTH